MASGSVFRVVASGGPGLAPQPIDEGEVRRALSLLADPEAGCQIFGLPECRHANRKGGDLDGLVSIVQQLRWNEGIYLVLNPLTPGFDLTGPASYGKRLTKKDILYRRWLFLDIDPLKPEEEADNPATDAEHELTRQAAEEIQVCLAEEQGWPAPLLIDSGNGWYLQWRINLPNNDHSQAIIREWSRGLAERVKSKAVVDPKVHDAPRLAKIPGTIARKGTPSDDRPWRPCRLVFVPSELEVVSAQMIIEATSQKHEAVPTPAKPSLNGHKKSPFTLRVSGDGAKAYVRKALDNECLKVALSRPPAQGGEGRNNALNEAAFSLGTLVGASLLTRAEVESRLRDVARQCGLYEDAKCGESGVEATIRSGLEAGIAEPRDVKPKGVKVTSAASVNDKGPTTEPGELLTVGADEIKPEPIDWLWYGRLPKGKLVTWAGQTGLGKSFLSCDISARLSVGAEIPFGKGECFPVSGTLMLNCEDGYADTIVPRLIEAGASLRMIRFMKTEKLASWTMAHLDSLERAIKETPDCRLVVLDAAPSFLGGIDDHKNAELRQIITPLALRVQEWGVTIIFVTHFNKAGSNKVEVLDRVMGGVAWVSGVRTAAAFIKAPMPEEPERRLCVTLKSNISRKPPALAYRLVNVDGDNDRCRVDWLEEIDTTAEEAMEAALRGSRPRKVVASEWLIERFREKREWLSDDLFAAARQENISRDAIFEAKNKLILPRARRVVKENGDVHYVWWVPETWPHLRCKEDDATILPLHPDEGPIPE